MKMEILQNLNDYLDEISMPNILEKISTNDLTQWLELWYNSTKAMVAFLIEEEHQA